MSLLDSLRQRLKVIERQFAAAVTPMRELDLGRDDFIHCIIWISLNNIYYIIYIQLIPHTNECAAGPKMEPDSLFL